MKNLLGNYSEMVEKLALSLQYPYSYLSDEWDDITIWQGIVKGKLMELASYNPPATPLNPKIIKTFEHDGVHMELISWDQPYGPPTEAYFLKPLDCGTKKLPAVLALHDHGGFKYFGKEKITALPSEHEILHDFKKQYYEGVSWTTRLAKRGYAVLVHDTFIFGSRKMITDKIPEKYKKVLEGKEEGSSDYITAYNTFGGEHDTFVAKSLFIAGATVLGVMLYEDMRALDYLFTRQDINRDRVGCGGLSVGGLRTIFLTAMENRLKCSVGTGFMSTFTDQVEFNMESRSWMTQLPHLSRLMDLPDVITLSGGNPLMVQFCENDNLFTIKGMKESSEKIEKIFRKMKKPDNYSGRFYPVEHMFNLKMQEDAFAWYDRWI